jgi:peptidoglycan biosynthesis protein MviN/MurJ (putative lipid II flippase)
VDRYFASYYAEGSVAVLGFAFAIVQVAVLVAAKAASWETYPAMAAARADPQKFEKTISAGVQTVLQILMPVLFLLVILRTELVQLAYSYGMLDLADVTRVSKAVLFYSGAVIALALGNVITFAHYSLKDTVVPAIAGLAGFFLQILLALLLLEKLGYLAPAFSYSISSFTTLILLSILLQSKMPWISWRLLLLSMQSFPAGIAGAITTLALRFLLIPAQPGSWAELAMGTIACAAGGIIAYALVLRWTLLRGIPK